MKYKREYYYDKETKDIYFVDICLGIDEKIIKNFMNEKENSGILQIWTYQDEDIDELKEIIKDNNYIFIFGPVRKDHDDKIFNNILEYVNEMQLRRKTDDFNKWTTLNDNSIIYKPIISNITEKYTRKLKLERIIK